MNINNILVKFASQDLILARTSTERTRIDNSLNALESKIKYGFSKDVNKCLRFGSYTRNTILPRRYDSNSDVDLMVIFNVPNGRIMPPNTYRTKIHQLLVKSYPNSFSSKDFPAVKLELNHIMFDLVPAYTELSLWSNAERFYIPDKYNEWRETFPNDINANLSKQNQAIANNTLRNVIRLCKHWNSSKNYPLESYLMEKKIIEHSYWSGGNTYDIFLEIMNHIAGQHPGVDQALRMIKYYKGSFWSNRPADEAKQLQWLKKLLPGL